MQAKFKSFYTEWPQARQKMPYTLMQEMRIVPDSGYEELLEKLFFELMDGQADDARGDEGVPGAVLAACAAAAGEHAPSACREERREAGQVRERRKLALVDGERG